MASLSEAPVKKKRASAPKVTTGCITCKIRHVKCDEGKPQCQRCLATGRKCDGYDYQKLDRRKKGQPKNKSGLTQAPITTNVVLSKVPVSKKEHHALDYFFNRVAPELSAYFDGPFWNRLVLQLSRSEPAIRHAMIALSTAYEQMERSKNGPLSAEASACFSLMQYNKAMTQLVQRYSPHYDRVEVPLIACLLFICLEYIRGDVNRAIMHISSGVKIVETWQQNKKARGSIELLSKEMMQETETVEQFLVRTFTCLNISSSMLDCPSTRMEIEESPNIEPFPQNLPRIASVFVARTAIYDIINQGIAFVTSVMGRKYLSQISPEDIQEQSRLRPQIEAWRLSLETFIYRNIPDMAAQECNAAVLLLLHLEVGSLLVATALRVDECVFDQYIPEFGRIISLCEVVTPTAPLFSFDIGFLIPLYYVACKCREPVSRRRALTILHNVVPRRESLYTAERTYKVALRIMQLEEAAIEIESGSNLPPENARIHYSDAIKGDKSAQENPEYEIVTFFSRPNGIKGTWKVLKESMALSDGILPAFDSNNLLTDFLTH